MNFFLRDCYDSHRLPCLNSVYVVIPVFSKKSETINNKKGINKVMILKLP